MRKTTTKIVVVCCLLIAAVFTAAGCKKSDSTDPTTDPTTALSVTVSYDANTGTGDVESATYTAVQFPDATAASGEGLTGPAGKTTFSGWATEAGEGGVGAGETVEAGASLTDLLTAAKAKGEDTLTLYAKWS